MAKAVKTTETTTENAVMQSYVVVKAFSDNPTIQPDRSQARRYIIGDDVSQFDADRLVMLESKGYVEKA